MTLDTSVRRVYQELSRRVLELAGPFKKSLEAVGIGAGNNGYDFREKLTPVVGHIMTTSFDQPPLVGLAMRGVANPRREMMVELIRGFGISAEDARRDAAAFVGQDANHWRYELGRRATRWWHRARKTYRNLERIERDMQRPFQGGEDGLEQTIEGLQRFPDLANQIYDAVQFNDVRNFPPEWTGPPSQANLARPQQMFVIAVKEELDEQWWQDVFAIAGLAVLGIALTVITAGTLGPVAAGVLGAGVGTVQGGVMVYDASQAVTEGRTAVHIGAMNPETLARLENELQGAWGALAVDAVTGGLIGRFGGTRMATQLVRGTLISAAGGGLSTAVNPNVWEDPNVVALIFQGTLIGGVSGAAGVGLGVAGGRALQVGQKMQFAINRDGGPLRVGRKVRVGVARDGEPIDGTVTAVDAEGGTVRMRVADQEVTMRVEKTTAVSKTDDAATPGRVRSGAGVAAWVRQDAKAPLQRAVDLGPNSWAAMPNRPTGRRFQRGLSGDYTSGRGGYEEARGLLAGQTDTAPRTVSLIGESVTPGRGTHEVTAGYSDPLSIRGRSDRVDPSMGRDPSREAMIKDLSLDDVEGLGFFPNMSTPWTWARNYQRLMEAADITPTPGSRGANFHRDLDAVMATATWRETEFGNALTNESDMNMRLRQLFLTYGSRTEESGFRSTRYAN